MKNEYISVRCPAVSCRELNETSKKNIHFLKLTFSPLKIGNPKRKLVFQPLMCICDLFVSGRVFSPLKNKKTYPSWPTFQHFFTTQSHPNFPIHDKFFLSPSKTKASGKPLVKQRPTHLNQVEKTARFFRNFQVFSMQIHSMW